MLQERTFEIIPIVIQVLSNVIFKRAKEQSIRETRGVPPI